MEAIQAILENQKQFFDSGITKDLHFRKNSLKVLYQAVQNYEEAIIKALNEDLNKTAFESYATEIGLVLEEITYMLKHMDKLLKPKRVRTPLTQFPSKSRIYREPYGQVLIMSPWNYPFLLNISPLIGAIACGNCAIIKPSEHAPATSSIIKKLIEATFAPEYISVIEGGLSVNQALLNYPFDFIFFTGSTRVGRIVMEKAAKHLTPVVLELGGKSPCIVDDTADIAVAAKRIVWGKLINAGQTCVAPDYLLVHCDIKDALIQQLIKYAKAFYGEVPSQNKTYPKIIHHRHFQRLTALIETGTIIYGGDTNEVTQQIGFTLMDNVYWEDPIMQEEIFGPILPIVTYKDTDAMINSINQRPKPLALYLFTTSKAMEAKIIQSVPYGGGCINDTLVHLATPYMGFGGVGESGMGNYHGKASIHTFSHEKSVLKKYNWLDIPVRYAPYGNKLKQLKWLMK